MDASQVERIYTRYARIYDKTFGRALSVPRIAAVRGLEIKRGARVLEVGVGTGLTLPMYPRHCDVIGIDISAAMLREAEKRCRADRLEQVKLMHMDAAHLQFADDSFDMVVAAYVITVVPDHRRVIEEMMRVCRPGGRLIFVNHFRNGNPFLGAIERAISPLCKHIGFRTDLTVDTMLAGTGLELARTERLNPLKLFHIVECINTKPTRGLVQ